MRKRKVLWFGLGAGLVLIAVVWAISRDREPSYNGRRLSEWVDLLPEKQEEASDAIHHMGTNTFPMVLKWLRSGPAPWKVRTLFGLPNRHLPDFLLRWLDDIPAQVRIGRAYQVVDVLKEEAAPIAPELLRVSYHKRQFVAGIALRALRDIGTPGVPYLIRVLRDPNHPHRVDAVHQIGMVLQNNPASTNAFQALIEFMADKDGFVRLQASLMLAAWAREQPAPAMIDEFETNKESTNVLFLRMLRGEMLGTNSITNSSPR